MSRYSRIRGKKTVRCKNNFWLKQNDQKVKWEKKENCLTCIRGSENIFNKPTGEGHAPASTPETSHLGSAGATLRGSTEYGHPCTHRSDSISGPGGKE